MKLINIDDDYEDLLNKTRINETKVKLKILLNII